MKPSWPVWVCATLCLSAALGQDGASTQDDVVPRLRGRITQLEERVASLERLVIRLAARGSDPKPTLAPSDAPKPAAPKPKAAPREAAKPTTPRPKVSPGVHDYFLSPAARALPADRVPRISWLRKIPGLKYARPRRLHLQGSLRIGRVLRAIVRSGSKPLADLPPDTLALGFLDGDRVLSINGVQLEEAQAPKRLRIRLARDRRLAVLVGRKGARLVLSYSLTNPVALWGDWPRPPTPLDLARRYALVMASVAVDGADRNTVILYDRATSRSVGLGVGDQLDGYRVLSIAVVGEGEEREAEVTLWTPEGKTVIRLFRKPRDR